LKEILSSQVEFMKISKLNFCAFESQKRVYNTPEMICE